MVTSLQEIHEIATSKEEENTVFRSFLQQQDGDEIDSIIGRLNHTVSAQIDCTVCGNCCKSLMINVTEEEAGHLAAHLQQTRESFDETYLEKSDGGRMLMNTIPCSFLSDDKCTVYSHRFAGCREFPGLHLPQFNKRLFTIFMHYERCPIIFNVVEQLKMDLNFTE